MAVQQLGTHAATRNSRAGYVHSLLALAACLLASACGFDRGEHSATTCSSQADCEADEECFAGFCIPDTGSMSGNGGSGGTGGVGGSGGTGGGGSGGTGGGEACTGSATEACYDGSANTEDHGPCRGGERLCVNGAWSQCLGQVVDGPEQCNGRDDDCDDEVDEIDNAACETMMPGVCATGTLRCVGAIAVCQPSTERTTEACDELDNDCDDEVDEDTTGLCFEGVDGCVVSGVDYQCDGVCTPGTRACGGNAECIGAVLPITEECEDVNSTDTPADEDCDGEVDEGCACTGNATRPCYGGQSGTEGVGECIAGTQTCVNDVWGDCVGDRGPTPESCVNEGEDNNCNGIVDDVTGAGVFCTDETMQGDCRIGTRQCQGSTVRCITPDASVEVCDGGQHDEDCDGMMDEGFDLNSDEDNCGSCGNACGDTQTCCAGQCVDLGTNPEACGACDVSCGGGSCCSGDCADTTTDTANCGGCGVACSDGQSCCGSCTNTDVDANNCGACGLTCADGQFCCGGGCQDTSCSCSVCEAAGGTCCDESCTDTATDELNCGGCGETCDDGETCLDGVCCEAGEINCEGHCVASSTDEGNCGGCGIDCQAGTACCDGVCVDLDLNPANCGACGALCQSPSSCSNGACCPAGTTRCGSSCVDTSSSAAHCGGCGITCDQGEACCGGVCRDLYTDRQACGSCNTVCGLLSQCCQGECVRGGGERCACAQDCGPTASCCGTSCENLMDDETNCGGCGIACGKNRICCNGVCQSSLGLPICPIIQ